MSKPPETPPKEIAQFEVVQRLGAGGMAEVFLAKKRGAEGTYKALVLKRILPTHGSSRRFRSMFIEEAHLATRLNHPNVVQVYEFQDVGDEGLLLAMEYVEGCDLGRLMSAARASETRIPPWVGAWIIAEAAKGLHYAHEKKDEAGQPLEIVHRDVSPQNILLSFEGAVKIADFGIASARLFADEQGVLKGKFGYMSPEQARGESVDRRSDLYALGVILWEILVGRPIHGGLGGEALLDIVRSGIVEPPTLHAKDVPPDLAQIVLRALAAARDERFATGRELSAALGRAIVRQGELIDASTLEGTLAQLVPRDGQPPELDDPASDADDGGSRAIRSDDARTQAAVPLARSMAESRAVVQGGRVDRPSATSGLDGEPEPSAPPLALRSPPPVADGPREVRHVTVMTLHLHGLEAVVLPRRTLDQLRAMLDDLAFKRGMRWVWSTDVDARAIAGLTANPSRAAIDAAQLALDVHETISGFKEDLPTPVAASMGIVRGIASGSRDPQGHLVRYVLHDPTAYLGDMLGKQTPMGRTWVAGGVYRLVRRDFRWGDAPTMHLRPSASFEVPPTMRIYALERSLSREERLADAQGASSDLVGRDAEKADLHAAYHAVVKGGGGAGQLVCRAVVGEMGIGKTALVATFLSELPPKTRLVHVECTPVQMEVPYAAVAELVRGAIGASGDEPFDQVAELIARAGGGDAGEVDVESPMVERLAELATNRQVGAGDEDAHVRRKNILAGVRSLLSAIALAQPIVLVVEGLHWSDKASLEAVAEIVHGSDPLPIFVLLVTRPDDRVAQALDGVMRIELRGLGPQEQVRLVEARLGVRDGARQVCADLLPKVGGNPFFLLEMIDALLERGALEIRETESDKGERKAVLARTDRSDAGFGALPSTLEQLLGDRIGELPPQEHGVVDWLAIAGGPLSMADIGKLTHKESDEAVVRLCARGLCDRKGEQVDFRHPLTRDVAYAALLPDDRAAMHRTLGAHLAGTSLARGLSAAIVARHFARGERYESAADFYFEAAHAARGSHQTQLAIRYYKRALAYVEPTDRRRVGGHEALESSYRVLGRRRERLLHLDALRRIARQVGTPRAVCLGLLRSARYDFDEGHLARGSGVARRAAEVAHAARIPAYEVEAEALVSDFLRELGDVQGALAACDRALAAFGPTAPGPPLPARLRGEVLRSRGILLRRVGRVREAVDAYADAIAIFRRSGARRVEARVKNALAYAMFVQGRYEDAVSLALESIQIDLSIGGRFQIAKTLTNIGHTYFRLGDVSRALAYLKRAREAHDRYGDQDGWSDTLLVSALVTIELSDLDAAEAFLRDASALNAATENAYDRTHESLVRALLARARRQPSEAIEHALASRHAAERMALVAFHFYAMAIEAAARVDLGEMHAATLVATTALGAVENLQGCEYGLEIRSMCADALKRAGSPQAASAQQRAEDHARALLGSVRDPRLRRLFTHRPMNAALFETTPVPLVGAAEGSGLERTESRTPEGSGLERKAIVPPPHGPA
jgi:serine/threonine protein kinase/tetratricopeptide (TPR) repeat protein